MIDKVIYKFLGWLDDIIAKLIPDTPKKKKKKKKDNPDDWSGIV